MAEVSLNDTLAAFVRTREALLEAARSVPVEKRRIPFVGHWDLVDLMAHLVGWDRTNLAAVEAFEAGRLPDFYADHEPSWDRYNAKLVAEHRTEDWDALVSALRASQARFVERVGALATEPPPVEWNGRKVSLSGILNAAIRDEHDHLQQIRELAAAPLDANAGNS